MLKIIDNIPLPALIIIALFLGIAPLGSQPHLVEKTLMLFSGELVKPIDIFDLFLHSTPIILLAIKLIRIAKKTTE
jgi:hypothetical protein